jgi:hypothetical protein
VEKLSERAASQSKKAASGQHKSLKDRAAQAVKKMYLISTISLSFVSACAPNAKTVASFTHNYHKKWLQQVNNDWKMHRHDAIGTGPAKGYRVQIADSTPASSAKYVPRPTEDIINRPVETVAGNRAIRDSILAARNNAATQLAMTLTSAQGTSAQQLMVGQIKGTMSTASTAP